MLRAMRYCRHDHDRADVQPDLHHPHEVPPHNRLLPRKVRIMTTHRFAIRTTSQAVVTEDWTVDITEEQYEQWKAGDLSTLDLLEVGHVDWVENVDISGETERSVVHVDSEDSIEAIES